MATREKARFGKIMLEGTKRGTGDELVLMETSFGHIVMATGTTVPVNGTTGYLKNCLFLKMDAVGGGTYLNKGTSASCEFTLVTQA